MFNTRRGCYSISTDKPRVHLGSALEVRNYVARCLLSMSFPYITHFFLHVNELSYSSSNRQDPEIIVFLHKQILISRSDPTMCLKINMC